MCDPLAPGRGPEIAARWRARQIEASWLRTIMDRWADFDVVTREALVATLEELGIHEPAGEALAELADAYATLPLRDGAASAVQDSRETGLVTGILSNGSQRTLDRAAARLGLPFEHVLSVDAVRRFKPDRAVYQLAVDATALPADSIGFVSANGWDAAGAAAFGFHVVWLRPTVSTVMPVDPGARVTVATWTEVAREWR